MSGMKTILIRTVDTDVVVLAIAFARKLEVEELWVAFGTGKHLRYLPIHKIASSLTPQQCEGLPFFHTLTGCDTVSYYPEKVRRPHFKYGSAILRRPKFSVLYLRLRQCSPRSNSRCWSGSWF